MLYKEKVYWNMIEKRQTKLCFSDSENLNLNI